MTKRLTVGVLFVAIFAFVSATTVLAEPRGAREWKEEFENILLPQGMPEIFRASAGTTWVLVNQNCDPEDVEGSVEGQTVDHIWCFEAANGDSTWPAVPAGQNTGSKKETFHHWSRFDPPLPAPSKWHVSTRHENPNEADTYNAWMGCPTTTGTSRSPST
jgi:hypothetical protein